MSNGVSDSDKSAQTSILVAQYNALRSEIILRATAQSTLLQINITAQGTVAGFVLAGDANPLALLVIPILSPILGMLWIDHHEAIVGLGTFIKSALEPKYGAVANFDFPRYPEDISHLPRSRLHIVGFMLAVVISFGLLPAAALIYVAAHTDIHSAAFYLPASLAAILLAIFLLMFKKIR